MLQSKKKHNRLIIQAFKHEQLLKLILSFQTEINKLIAFFKKILYCKLFNLKVLLLRKLLVLRQLNLPLLSSNAIFCDSQLNTTVRYLQQLLQLCHCFEVTTYNSNYVVTSFLYTCTQGVFFVFVNTFSDVCGRSICASATFFRLQLVLFFFFILYVSFFSSCLLFFFSLSLNFASLPNKLKKFTVLKSPHTDKKSREQFELKTYKKVLRYPSLFFSYYNYIFSHKHVSFACNITHKLLTFKLG